VAQASASKSTHLVCFHSYSFPPVVSEPLSTMSLAESSEDPRAPILEKEGATLHKYPWHPDASTSRFRLVYLTLNISANILMMGFGFIVYERTNSLSVMIDWLGGSVTLLALVVSIAVEFMKTRVQTARTVLILDLVGCVVSVVLLVGVAVFGIVDAVYRTKGAQSERVSHLKDMILFSACSFSVDIITLCFYWGLKKWMLQGDSGEKKADELNVLSSLLHLITDLGSSMVILVTAVAMQYGNFSGESWWEAIAHKVAIDSSGAVVVCICLAVAIVMFQQDAAKSIELIRALDDEKEQVDYGTMPRVPEV